MAKTRRRGGAWTDYLNPRNWGKSAEEIAAAKKAKCDEKKAALDKECGPGEASAAEVPTETPVTDTAPPSSGSIGGRSRRRRQTRRKSYKGGKHRRGH